MYVWTSTHITFKQYVCFCSLLSACMRVCVSVLSIHCISLYFQVLVVRSIAVIVVCVFDCPVLLYMFDSIVFLCRSVVDVYFLGYLFPVLLLYSYDCEIFYRSLWQSCCCCFTLQKLCSLYRISKESTFIFLSWLMFTIMIVCMYIQVLFQQDIR